MKKIFYGIAVMLVLFVGIKCPKAATEKDLLKRIEQVYNINGVDYSVSEDIKVTAKRYLDEYEVSDEDCDYIISKIDEAVAIVKKSNATKIEDLSAATKNELKALVADVSANTSVKGTIKNGKVVVYKPDGSGVFAEVSGLVKQTDFDANYSTLVVGISAIVTLIGATLIIRKFNSCE